MRKLGVAIIDVISRVIESQFRPGIDALVRQGIPKYSTPPMPASPTRDAMYTDAHVELASPEPNVSTLQLSENQRQLNVCILLVSFAFRHHFFQVPPTSLSARLTYPSNSSSLIGSESALKF